MAFQIIQSLRKPVYGSTAIAVSLILLIAYFYFEGFLFFVPFVTFYVSPDQAGAFALDLTISSLSGIVISMSIFQVKNASGGGKGVPGKVGVSGIVTAFVAGACPCYYLVPLLAVAGGAGGVLAVIGETFSNYQLPIKLASLAMLGFVVFTLERSLRASCKFDQSDSRRKH